MLTIVRKLWLPLLLIAAVACGVEQSPAAAPTPIPTPSPAITREEAIEIALDRIERGWLGRLPAILDYDSVTARLIQSDQFASFNAQGWFSGPGYGSIGPLDPAWAVQVKGESTYTVGDRIKLDLRYAMEVISTHTGGSVMSARTVSEPFLISPEIAPDSVPGVLVDPFTEVTVSRQDAIEIMIERNEADSHRSRYVSSRIETELVRIEDGRLAWWVFVPAELSFRGCGGPPRPDNRFLLCWEWMVYELVDAETGEVFDGELIGKVVNAVRPEESAALHRFAYAEGWWELFHRLEPYTGQPLPPGLAAELDRPNAPTPTPRPPTPTPDPNRPPPPTPTPPPPSTATAARG